MERKAADKGKGKDVLAVSDAPTLTSTQRLNIRNAHQGSVISGGRCASLLLLLLLLR